MKIGTISAFLLVCSLATIQVQCGPLAFGETDKAVVSSLGESNPHAAAVPASSYQDKLLELEDNANPPTSESVDGKANVRQKRLYDLTIIGFEYAPCATVFNFGGGYGNGGCGGRRRRRYRG